MESRRLLVVDDDNFTRLALNAFFRRGGWEVSLAASVAEAVAMLDRRTKCVILDLDLPDGGGEEVLEYVRTHLPETQILVCSGVSEPTRLAEIRRLAPDVMMSKPIDLATVYRLRETAIAVAA